MGVIKHYRHKSSGKKTVHGTGTLSHVPTNNIISSFLDVLSEGIEPTRSYRYAALRSESPP